MEFWNDVILPALQGVTQDILSVLPKILAALIILLVGWITAKLFENLIRRLLKRIGFNGITEKTGISGFLKNAGFNKDVSWLVGRLIFWMLILVFMLAAAEALELTTLALSIQKVVAFIPNLIVVILILVFGAMLARFSGRLVRASALEAELEFADFLGKLVNNVVLIFIAVLAFSQLELDSNILDTTFGALIGAFALAIALMVGLGSRRIAYNIICGVYARRTYRLGQYVEVDQVSGQVVQIGTINSILRLENGLISIPNSTLIEKKTLMPDSPEPDEH